MFAKTIIDSDAFLDMPMSARLLYYDLAMRADDDGFVNSPKKIMRMVGATPDDLSILALKKFIIPFDNGVVVIKHWYIHNYIRKDTYNETPYKEQKELLEFDENKSYRVKGSNETDCIRSVDEPSTQVSIGKDSIGNINNILSGEKSDNAEKKSFSEEISKVINYLNDVLGTRYTTKSKSTNEKIKARLEEGHTVDDFKKVIDNKKREWGDDPIMVKYLRPETLFRASHFESYLNEVENDATRRKREEQEINERQRKAIKDADIGIFDSV